MNHKSVIFIGRSGCGKGTQSALLIDYFKKENRETLYLSTGNEFRKLISEGDNFTSKKVEDIYEKGGRHPDFLCITILGNYFKNNFTPEKNLIMDGGLRSLNEALTVTDIFDFYEVKDAIVINLDVSHDWSVKKMKDRHRDDDNMAIFEVKKKWYEEEVVPAIEYLENNPRYRFYKIDGEQDIQKIHEDIISKIQNG